MASSKQILNLIYGVLVIALSTFPIGFTPGIFEVPVMMRSIMVVIWLVVFMILVLSAFYFRAKIEEANAES